MAAKKFNKNDFLGHTSDISNFEPISRDLAFLTEPFIIKYVIPLFLHLFLSQTHLPTSTISSAFRQAYTFDSNFSGVFYFHLLTSLSYSFLNVPRPDFQKAPNKRCYVSDFLSCFGQYSSFCPSPEDEYSDIHERLYLFYHKPANFFYIAQGELSYIREQDRAEDIFKKKPPFLYLTKASEKEWMLHRVDLPVIQTSDFFFAESFNIFDYDLDPSKFAPFSNPFINFSELPILPRKLSSLFFSIFVTLSPFFFQEQSFKDFPLFSFSHMSTESSLLPIFKDFDFSQKLLLETLSENFSFFFQCNEEDQFKQYLYSLNTSSSDSFKKIYEIEDMYLFLCAFIPFLSFLHFQKEIPLSLYQRRFFLRGFSLLSKLNT